MTDYVQITTTAGTREEADRIAREVVERRLAACVQVVGPIASTYRWRGEVETAEEWLCLVKTIREAYPRVEEAVRELHSYEVPELLALPVVAGSDDYLQWIGAETSAG